MNNPVLEPPGNVRLDDHELKLDALLEFCGELEGQVKELRRWVKAHDAGLDVTPLTAGVEPRY